MNSNTILTYLCAGILACGLYFVWRDVTDRSRISDAMESASVMAEHHRIMDAVRNKN